MTFDEKSDEKLRFWMRVKAQTTRACSILRDANK